MTRQPLLLGMTLLVMAESVFFLMLILAFWYFRAPAAGFGNLHAPLALLSTGCLLGGCLAMLRASAVRPESHSRVRVWAGVAILFGGLCLLAEANQYVELFREGATISQSLFGTTFFTLTGIHGGHVLIGIFLAAILMIFVANESSGERRQVAVRAVAMYWCFLAAAGVAIALVVYGGALL